MQVLPTTPHDTPSRGAPQAVRCSAVPWRARWTALARRYEAAGIAGRVLARRHPGPYSTQQRDSPSWREPPLEQAVGEDVLAVHAALERLATLDERQSRVVECRFFAGMSIEETAEALHLSPASIKREWALARAWLNRELARGGA